MPRLLSALCRLALPLGIWLAFLLVLAPRVHTTTFHTDESGWVSAGFYYSDLLARGDFNRQAWDGATLSRWGDLNPNVGKLAIGAALRLGGAPHWFGLYDITRSRADNIAAGLVPPDAVLIPARFGVACFGALACVLLFLIGRAAAGPWCGALAAAFLGLNPLFENMSTRVMIDIPFLTLLLAICLTAMRLLHAAPERALRYALLCGGLSGLAGLVKIHGFLIGPGIMATTFAVRAHILGGWKRTVQQCAAALALTVCVGYLLTPNFWPQWNALDLGAARAEASAIRNAGPAAFDGKGEDRFKHFEETFPALANVTRPLRLPLLFVRWKAFNHWVAQTNPAWCFHEHRVAVQAGHLFWLYSTFPGEGLLGILGLVLLSSRVVKAVRARTRDSATVVLSFFAVNYLVILAFQDLDWNRYYLASVVGYQIPAAFAVLAIASSARALRARRG